MEKIHLRPSQLCMGNGDFHVLKSCLPFGLIGSCEVGEIGLLFSGNVISNTILELFVIFGSGEGIKKIRIL